MTGRAAFVCALLLAGAALPVYGQVTRPRYRPPTSDTAAARRAGVIVVPRDTARTGLDADTSLHWSDPDSVMRELLDRGDYTATRYEGDVVTFNAQSKALEIANTGEGKAQVEREGQRVVTDSTIVYNDLTRDVLVGGHFKISLGNDQPPIAGLGTARYNLAERSGRLTNAQVTVEESGTAWFIRSQIGKTALGDSTRGIATRFYGVGGSLTSCDDSVPDYHFALREIKRTNNTLVARPAVLYIQDIPVLWLPFVFQDIRPGRRSGILPPRFGASDIVRNNPSYHRHVENLGYYWAINDYMGATTWLDWRSGAANDSIDPGWYRVNGEWQYRWLSRFITGSLATSYMRQPNQLDNFAVTWMHQERFGQNRNVTLSGNYVTSTRLQRQNTFDPYQAMSTIKSSATYSDKLGPASLQIGGTRTQYPGRDQIDQTLPTMSLTAGSLALAKWLVWTPNLSYTETARLHSDLPTPLSVRYGPGTNGRLTDTTRVDVSSYQRSLNFDTPLRIFGYDLRNSVAIADLVNDFPDEKLVFPHADSAQKQSRVFARTYSTTIDWNPTITPPQLGNRFKITPSIALQNVDGHPFWIRTEMTGGRFVHQSKRLVYGVSASPAVYGLFPGFGPFSRIRHAITPVISYNIAPRASIDPEYLAALGATKQGYLGALPQSAVTLQFSQNFEAKVKAASADSASTAGEAQKIKLLSLNFSSLTYDFQRAKAIHRRLGGLTTDNFGATMRSDLLPGFDLGVDYSLFQGATVSDTAVFKPFLTRVTSTFRISQSENPFAVITRLFGRAVPETGPAPEGAPGDRDAAMEREIASRPVAGQASRGTQFLVPTTRGWGATFNFSTSRPRPATGDRVLNYDPTVRCEPYREINPFAYEQCISQPVTQDELPATTYGSIPIQLPRQTSLSSNVNFALTQKWAASWTTSYDFERSQFASQMVSLQRDLHDWRAVFAFTKSPNGNFAFNFFIALKPQPDLKFDYSRASVGGQ